MRKRLLIADDDTIFLKLLSFEFERKDYDVDLLLAEDGSQTMALIAEHQPQLLLLDLKMPREDGFQVLSELREKHSHVPVVILTHYRDEDFKARCRNLGALDYLVKSEVGIEALAERILSYL